MASSTETAARLLSPVAESPSRRWDPGPVFGPVLAWGVLGFVAFVVEVLLLGGLRGSASGISAAIDALATLGAVLTQLLFVGGVILAVHLELTLLRSGAHWVLRALSVPITSVLCTFLMNAAVGELAPLPLVLVSVLSSLLALAAGAARVIDEKTREAGAVLLAAAVSALLWAGARVSAWQTTTLEAPPFHSWAPWLASAGWLTSAALTLFAYLSLARAKGRIQRTPFGGALVVAVLCAGTLLAVFASWAATRPPSFDESSWEVFLTRSLQGLLRTPLPALPVSLVVLEHLLGLGAAAWAFAHRGLPATQRVVFAFCLLALRAPDTPLLALGLTLAALFGAAPSRQQPA